MRPSSFITRNNGDDGPKASFGPHFFTALVALLVILIAFPFLTIWSLNVLFSLGIAYGFREWAAVNWLMLVLAWVLQIGTTKRGKR